MKEPMVLVEEERTTLKNFKVELEHPAIKVQPKISNQHVKLAKLPDQCL